MARLIHRNGSTDIAARTFYMLKDGTAILQERGTSQTDVMSQNAVTSELEDIDTKLIDLQQQKANKSDLNENYLTKEEAGRLYQPAGDYLTEIPEIDLTPYATKEEVPHKTSELENDAEFLTQAYLDGNYYNRTQVDERIDNVKANQEAFLHNFYDKEQIDSLLKESENNVEKGHEEIENRLSELEAIDHTQFLTEHQSLDNYYSKEETENKISEAIAGENLGALLTKSEAEEKFQPVGEYLTEHQSLENYYTKEESDSKFQPVGEYLTEHQSLENYYTKEETIDLVEESIDALGIENYETITEAKKAHEELKRKDNELDSRLEIVEAISATFIKFDNWEEGYYLPDDYGLTQGLQYHDMCYHQIIDVTGCKSIEFFFHYAPTPNNVFIFEYAGEPALNTFLKATPKEYFDMVLDLDLRTKYIVICALMPSLPVYNYYARGLKKDDDNGHVIYGEFNQLVDRVEVLEAKEDYDDSELKNRISVLEAIDHDVFATKEFVEEEINKIPEFDDSELDSRISTLEAIDHSKYLTEHQSLENYPTKEELEETLKEYTFDTSAIDASLSDLVDKVYGNPQVECEIRHTDFNKGKYFRGMTMADGTWITASIGEESTAMYYVIKTNDLVSKNIHIHVTAPKFNSRYANVYEFDGKSTSAIATHPLTEGVNDLNITLNNRTTTVYINAELNEDSYVGLFEPGDRITRLEIEVENLNEKGYDDSELISRIETLEAIDHNEFLKEHQSLEAYATKEEVNTAVESRFNEIVKDAPEQFNTFKEVADYIEEHKEVAEALNAAVNKKADKTALDDYYTKEEADGKFLTEHQSLEAYATKEEVAGDISEAVSGLASEEFVEGKISEIPQYDDSSLINRIETLEAIDHSKYLTEHQSLEAYATKEFVEENKYDDSDIKNRLNTLEAKEDYDDSELQSRISVLEAIDHTQYLTEHQSLEALATKEELEEVSDKVEAIESDYVKTSVLENYATKIYVDGKILDVSTEINEIEKSLYDYSDYAEDYKIKAWKIGGLVLGEDGFEVNTVSSGIRYMILDVSQCKRYVTFNISYSSSYPYLWEFSGEPKESNLLKQTDLKSKSSITLDEETKYIALCSMSSQEYTRYVQVNGKFRYIDELELKAGSGYIASKAIENFVTEGEVQSYLYSYVERYEYNSKVNELNNKITQNSDNISSLLILTNPEGGKTKTYNQWTSGTLMNNGGNNYSINDSASDLKINYYMIVEVGGNAEVTVNVPLVTNFIASSANFIFEIDDTSSKHYINKITNTGKEIKFTTMAGTKYLGLCSAKNTGKIDVKIAESIFSKIEGFATEEYVDQKISEIELPEEYNDSELKNRISVLEAIDHTQYLTEHQSLEAYATKEELEEVSDKVESDYATKIYVDGKIEEIPQYDDSQIKSEIAGIKNDYAKKSELTGLASEEFVENKISEIEIPEEYNDSEIKSRLSVLEAKPFDRYLTEHQSLEALATKEELEEVSDKVEAIESDYVTKNYVDGKTDKIDNVLGIEYRTDSTENWGGRFYLRDDDEVGQKLNTYLRGNYAIVLTVSELDCDYFSFKGEFYGPYKNRNNYTVNQITGVSDIWESLYGATLVQVDRVEPDEEKIIKVNPEAQFIIIGPFVKNSEVELTCYTKNGLINKVDELEKIDYVTKSELTGLATEEFVENKISEIEIPEFDDSKIYAELNKIEETIGEIDKALSEILGNED